LPRGHAREVQLEVRVTADVNWTYRSGQFDNPPDTVQVDNFEARVRARPTGG
jgi:hypothetical protein